MSATAAPFGLRPIGRLDSGSLEVFRQYPIASGYGTNIAMGDIVQLVDGGTATTIEKQSATGDDSTEIDMVGIFLGCKFTDPNTNQMTFSQLWPASTVASDAMAYVVDDPNVLFAIQADAAPTNTGDIYGKNTLLVQTAPNTTLKVSRVALDISELSTDAQNPIRVIDYLGGDQGDEKGTTYPILVCKFNYHQHSSTTGSA
jgi:hypothetical protein|tara:strand:+ start:689 stop:1291 length:603 start_codon:yes stop_codon:yes gene_type:complete